eukprot:CAMPEP_0175172342 /NCGR_PEP_ID=MMETSP0087-20121206/31373_1 /TAXON_ID=136419 /ORGANISM="Unknown Unknown, Strain D1" /LENGTH=118 /DNA_ID=CAMNT_0016463389 /DNA_START=226 /DNA_END=582 /DNA_ORIENTATION=-
MALSLASLFALVFFDCVLAVDFTEAVEDLSTIEQPVMKSRCSYSDFTKLDPSFPILPGSGALPPNAPRSPYPAYHLSTTFSISLSDTSPKGVSQGAEPSPVPNAMKMFVARESSPFPA